LKQPTHAGLVNIVFGVFMMASAGEGALAVLSLVATWVIVGGIFLVIVSFKVNWLGGRLDEVEQRLGTRNT
jgi:uncharacterized membrane protein HdeD (DUF308 family)